MYFLCILVNDLLNTFAPKSKEPAQRNQVLSAINILIMEKINNKMPSVQQGCEMDEAMKRWLKTGELPTVEEGKEFFHDLTDQNPIDSVARSVLENVETRITDDLYNDILESLRGFTDYVQLEIADDVLDYVCNKSVHKTNIKTVDTLLKGMYARIKEQHDHPEKFGLHIV